MSQFSHPVVASNRCRVALIGLLVVALFALGLSRPPLAHAAVAGKIAPAVVPAGAGVTIAGEGLSATTGVTFLGGAGPDDNVSAEHVIVVDAKKLAVQLPPGAQTGPVAVHGPDGTVNTGDVKVTIVPPPAIAAVSARSAQPGDVITITGENLTGSKKPAVTFGAKAGGIVTAVPGKLEVKVPTGLPGGPVTLRVTTDGGLVEAPFYIAPTIKSVTPAAGSTTGGNVVTIAGAGFTGVNRFSDDTATAGVNESFDGVTIGGQRVERLVAVSDTEIVAQTPPGTSAAAPVVVSTTRGGVVATSVGGPTYAYQPIPVITSVTPDWNFIAAVGDPAPVVIKGRNLTPATILTVGSTVITGATVDAVAGTITFTPPAAAKAAVVKLTAANVAEGGKAFSAVAQFAYVDVPAVTKVAPVSAPAGSTVTVSGTGFTHEATARFGDQPAACATVSFVALQCAVPAGAGAVDVVVTTAAGTSTASPKSTFTYTAGDVPAAPAPAVATVAAVKPGYGTTGTSIALTGANLHLATRVDFTGAEAAWVTAPNFLIVGPGRLVVTVPSGTASGPLRLTSANGRTIGGAYTASVRPAVDSIDVVGDATYGAAAGDMLTIKGRGLVVGPVRPMVTIGGKPAPVLGRPVPNPKTIVVKIPAHLGGRESVVVTTPLGTATAEATVYFVPQVKALKPITSSRAGGSVATISGSGLRTADNVVMGAGRPSAVTFGGTPAARMVVMSDKEIIAVTAAGSATADPVLIKTESDGWTGFSDDRARPNSSPVPTVNTISPNKMSLGETPSPVTITGTNLRDDSTVLFGTLGATVQSAAADGTSMIVLPPVRTTTSMVPVSVTNISLGEELTATLAGGFSYLPTPAISAVTPSTGLTGTNLAPVAITGTNLRLDTVVRFGDLVAAVQSVSTDGKTLSVTPPVRNDVGAVSVTVTNVLEGGEQLTATLNNAFNYSLAVATISGKSATTALPGATVTITGTSFVGVNAVRFGTVSAAYTVANATTIYATVPMTPSGAHGTAVDITVTNSTGQPSTANPATADDWTWSSHPIVTSISPGTGIQGSTVTVYGTGFTDTTAVRFGTTAAESFTFVNDTTITAVVPVTPAGSTVVDVSVVARGLQSPEPALSTANDWTWAPIAVITSMTPNPGAAGSTITVTGRHFTNVRSVTINGTAVTPTVLSSTQLTFVAPAKPGNKPAQSHDKPVYVTNGSGVLSTAEIDPATGKMANLFTWL